jgi:hypothetical protein
VTAWGCALREHAARNAELARIKRIIDILRALADRIYEQEAPWVGLRAGFNIEKNTYGLGEPITLNYTISNPAARLHLQARGAELDRWNGKLALSVQLENSDSTL